MSGSADLPDMEYTHLGRAGVVVSRMVLGTMNFGVATGAADAFAVMDTACERGINCFDTSNTYGGELGKGRTEEIIGRWLAQGGGRRERTVLATKVFNIMGAWPNERGVSAVHIRQACDASLRRLNTDHLDIYPLHHIDRNVRWEEIWEAMDVLRQQGKVTYVGSSNFGGWHIAQAQESAYRRGGFGLVSEQSRYSLLERTIELEVIPAAESYGLGVLCYSPLGGGLLAGIKTRPRDGVRRYGDAATTWLQSEENRQRLHRYQGLCEEIDQEPAAVALAWMLGQPGVTAPIIGPRTVEQFDDALKAFGVEVDDGLRARLDEIFPGHRPAPEDYAW
jgi:aryl-alcohol dehydrogenase-like predicted oxidoreductase